jgi:uncharacterized protein YfaS (alpha-2-macroglobulin family)
VVQVVDADHRPVVAVVPVQVQVRDPEGRLAEFSGAYGAADGQLEMVLDIAANDPFGHWQIEVRELASGRTANGYFRVRSPSSWPPAKGPIPANLAKPEQPKG